MYFSGHATTISVLALQIWSLVNSFWSLVFCVVGKLANSNPVTHSEQTSALRRVQYCAWTFFWTHRCCVFSEICHYSIIWGAEIFTNTPSYVYRSNHQRNSCRCSNPEMRTTTRAMVTGNTNVHFQNTAIHNKDCRSYFLVCSPVIPTTVLKIPVTCRWYFFSLTSVFRFEVVGIFLAVVDIFLVRVALINLITCTVQYF